MTNRRAVFTLTLILSAAFCAGAQQANRPAAPAPAPAAPANAADGRIAVIDTSAFADPKLGITRLSAAVAKVQAEFQPQRAELQKLQQQYEALLADIEKTRGVASQADTQRKADQAETLKRDIGRKSEDAEFSFNKRMQDAVGPLTADIVQSMGAFAQKRGITLLLDVSKLQGALLYVGGGSDVTREFIAEYNQQKPGTASLEKPTPSIAAIR